MFDIFAVTRTLNLQNIQITQDDSSTKEQKTQNNRNSIQGQLKISLIERRETSPIRAGGRAKQIHTRQTTRTNQPCV